MRGARWVRILVRVAALLCGMPRNWARRPISCAAHRAARNTRLANCGRSL